MKILSNYTMLVCLIIMCMPRVAKAQNIENQNFGIKRIHKPVFLVFASRNSANPIDNKPSISSVDIINSVQPELRTIGSTREFGWKDGLYSWRLQLFGNLEGGNNVVHEKGADVYTLSIKERFLGVEQTNHYAILYQGENKIIHVSEYMYIRIGPTAAEQNEIKNSDFHEITRVDDKNIHEKKADRPEQSFPIIQKKSGRISSVSNAPLSDVILMIMMTEGVEIHYDVTDDFFKKNFSIVFEDLDWKAGIVNILNNFNYILESNKDGSNYSILKKD